MMSISTTEVSLPAFLVDLDQRDHNFLQGCAAMNIAAAGPLKSETIDGFWNCNFQNRSCQALLPYKILR